MAAQLDRSPAHLPQPGRRIVVIGTSGTGKTTLAAQLARRLGYPHTEMDALHWERNWTEAPLERFRERVRQAAAGECWVIDGNYNKVREIAWSAADTVVWLDYPLWLILWRLFWRTIRRTLGGQVLWNGNRERFAEQFFSRTSLFVWVWQTYGRRKREYPELLRRPEHAHLTVIRLTSPRQTARWLAAVKPQ